MITNSIGGDKMNIIVCVKQVPESFFLLIKLALARAPKEKNSSNKKTRPHLLSFINVFGVNAREMI